MRNAVNTLVAMFWFAVVTLVLAVAIYVASRVLLRAH